MSTCTHCGAPARPNLEACDFCGAAIPKAPTIVQTGPVVVTTVATATSAAPAPPPLGGRCPRCRRQLVAARAEDLDLHGCGGCGGIWLGNAASKRLVEGDVSLLAVLADRAARNATVSPDVRHPVACPTCDVLLARVERAGLPLDVCVDHGTWFDAWELGALAAHIAKQREQAWVQTARGLEPKSVVVDVTCVACKKRVPANTTEVTEDGPTCDACRKEAARRALADKLPGV